MYLILIFLIILIILIINNIEPLVKYKEIISRDIGLGYFPNYTRKEIHGWRWKLGWQPYFWNDFGRAYDPKWTPARPSNIL